MTLQDVLALLEQQKNSRGIDHWNRLGHPRLQSFGLGVTQLKALAKTIGRNHDLALALWSAPYYDTKILATLVDDPKKVTPEQVEHQIDDADIWMLSHAYCSYLLPKTPFVRQKAVEWAASDDLLRRRCGYLLLYHLAKDNKQLPDAFFDPYLDNIEQQLQSEENFVRDAMNNALLAIGQRSRALNARAIEVARAIGKVVVDYGDNSCEAPDCLKHLTGARVQEKLQTR